METNIMVTLRQLVNFNKNHFEKKAWKAQSVVVGIDEVGRGCLAGPLVTAAVILPPGKAHRLLKDSKLMEPEERIKAYQWIMMNCAHQIGIVHNRIIDKHNIWHATLIAMKKALVNLLAQPIKRPSAILVDAMPVKLEDTGIVDIPVYYFIKGEKKSSSIAAASIVAKVTRDALMQKYDTLFPGYHMGQHKGYSTKCHKDNIRQKRHTIIHRISFLGAIKTTIEKDETEEQQTLC